MLTRARRLRSRLSMTHGLMVVAAMVAFVSTSSVLRDRQELIDVIVSAERLPRGSAVGDGDLGDGRLGVMAVPADHPLRSSLVVVGTLDAGFLVRDVEAGEPLLRSDVATGGSGLRTMTVPTGEGTVGGLGLVPGDRVDVLGVGADGAPVFVVVDLRIARLPDDASIVGLSAGLDDHFVTVEVDPGQALALAGAKAAGELQVLRSTGAEAIPGLARGAISGSDRS